MELFFKLMARIEGNKMLAGDELRDADFVIPDSIERFDNISYGDKGEYNLLCVNLPRERSGLLPCIVSVHGGGYFYGNKETYQYYCADLAGRGFAVVNMNYSLSPVHKFPTQLEELNQVLTWIGAHGSEYGMDAENVFLIGDSAGAQMVNHYTTIYTNSSFAKMFEFDIPENVTIRAVAMNSGMYDILHLQEKPLQLVTQAYAGKEYKKQSRRLDVIGHMTGDYLPSYIATAPNDFVRHYAKPQADLLHELGVECIWKEYGSSEDAMAAHVFHLNQKLPIAGECNDDECDFFKKHIYIKN